MDEDPVFGNDANFDPAAGQQIVKLPVTILVQKCLDLGRSLVPSLFQGCFPDVFGHDYVGGVELAVTNDLDFRDAGDFLTDKFKNRTPKIARDTPV